MQVSGQVYLSAALLSLDIEQEIGWAPEAVEILVGKNPSRPYDKSTHHSTLHQSFAWSLF